MALKSSILLGIFLILNCGLLSAQGIEFYHGTWEEVKEIAREQGKPIFVDAYATWCGPCKLMSKRVFTQPKVGEYYNTHFVNYKLDMESEEGLKFGGEYPVSAYPTLIYLQSNGDVIAKLRGAKDVKEFLQLGEEALKGFSGDTELMQKYEDGDRSYEVVLNYINIKRGNGESVAKAANDYLREHEDMEEAELYPFLIAALEDADSKIFKLLMENPDKSLQFIDSRLFHSTVADALKVAEQKAKEFDFPEIYEAAYKKYEAAFPDEAQRFGENN